MSVLALEDRSSFEYIITHVFCPLKLPDGDDHSDIGDHSLASAIATAARLYTVHASQVGSLLWRGISRFLVNLSITVQFHSLDVSQTNSQLINMNAGDVLAFMIRAQNAAVVFRKQKNVTIYESFELSPKAGDVMGTKGKLVCSYPGPAIEIPDTVFDDKSFLSELVNFLVHMDGDVLPDAAATTRKARSIVHETRDTTHPRYITELLTGILRSVGSPAEVDRISKRVGDDVVWNNSKLPWRRSSLWLLIRVVLQTTLNRTSLGRVKYKEFMLFFICCLGKESFPQECSNDVLQAIMAKISRRLRKLGSSAPDWLSRIALETCTSLRSILEERWTQVQDAQRLSPPWTPSKLDLSRDIQLTLLESGDYIRSRLANHNVDPPSTEFIPQHRRRGVLNDFLSAEGAFFEGAYRAEPHVALFDVEKAVEMGIDGWVDEVKNNDEACEMLEVLANKYSSSALKTYGNNPELLSVMLLTVVELWVALDKIAIKEIPMLAEYSPEIPNNLLESLLLSKASSLDRLRLVQQYLLRRHSQAKPRWSVFSDSATSEDTFAVRYFRGSSQHQQLKTRIEEAAQRDVQNKVAELERANTLHADRQRQADKIEHTCSISVRKAHQPDPSKRCTKCRLLKTLKKMKIDIHEWPLPAKRLQTEVVIFELECPLSFDMWRAATFHLLVDLCSPSLEPEIPYITLGAYDPLRPYVVKHPRSRISLCSDTKPFIVTHYRTKAIPTDYKSVCVPNGLAFYGYDSHACIPVSTLASHIDIGRYCTYQLQGGLYQNLQKFVDSTSHTSNEVMANQADCHKNLSIHEFVAFGHLRSGSLLQWLNILRELRGPSLSFRHPEVHLLIAQAVSQIGSLGDSGWVWHQELEQHSFCHALLEGLEALLYNVEANWLEAATMDTISFLLRRLLASRPDQTISLHAIELLRAVRSKMFSWVVELSAKLMESPGDEELRGVLRDSAAICRSTYDVDSELISDLLNTAEDIDVLLFSAMLIHDNTPSKLSSIPAYSQLLLDRDRRLSLVLESFVSSLIEGDPSDGGINSAISRVWDGYRPGSKWIPLQNLNSRWFSCTTSSTAEQRAQGVHLNLLDGTLLVDTKQLGRLPDEILCHPLYDLIFGERVLDVIPGDLPGMDYSTRGTVSNHQVYFSLKNGSDLVIRVKPMQITTDDAEIMELIPRQKLTGDLPAILIEGHVHLLSLLTSVIEIRPLERMWEASPENWIIDSAAGQYRMRKGKEFLLDIRSPSWKMVSDLLRPLDIPTNLLVSVLGHDRLSMRLSVVLPRYGLSFYVDEDKDLQSRNIRGMVYDENQSIGTLFGLVNQLVLRPKIRDGVDVADAVPHSVLIPEGKVSFCTEGHHVCVEINTQRQDLGRVTFQIYQVNTDVGHLETIGLTNKLYCTYLHALTSGCGTDPLTGRSGTEETLSLLCSASCWSVMKFAPRDAELLSLIASLSPSHSWYPIHLKCMQKVEWLDLPAHSQCHELFVVAKNIQGHFQRLCSFHENKSSQLFEAFPSCEDHLLERSAIRAACLFPSESSGLPTGASSHSDVCYTARDVVEHRSAEHRAYTAATIVYHRTARETITKNVLGMVERWPESVSGHTLLSLRYDTSWLAPGLPLIWLEAYNLLRRNDDKKWFQLLFSLPAMAYASPELSDLVPVLVTFATHQEFRLEHPPNYDSYDISDGYSPTRTRLHRYVSDSAYSFELSPESSEPAKHNKNTHEKRRRQLKTYQGRVNSDANATVNELLRAWPCETPPSSSLNSTLYDVGSLTSKVERHFSTCYHNLKLKEHLTRVQKILRSARVSPASPLSYTFSPSKNEPNSVQWTLTEEQLFSRTEPLSQVHDTLARDVEPMQEVIDTPPSDTVRLYQLINTAKASAANPFQCRYISALLASAERFETEPALVSNDGQLPPAATLLGHYVRCRENYIERLRLLQRQLGPNTRSEEALERSGQWPRVTPHTLLRFLASNSPIAISKDWKRCLVEFALLALELQRARRLLQLHLDDRHEELRKELENEGCDGWNAETHPDWLLIQLQGNFFIRRVQAEVANEMISPRSGDNTAMQLNMGEGKSSVIVPIVVVDLADGDQLVRVIVPKALTAQMFQLLVDRLGGLTNRRIYFLPFSRSLKVDDQKAKVLRDIMTECMKERGILVVQPEHVLSLKLVSVEKQLPGVKDAPVGLPLLELQKWLHSRSRDILDESDEILHVRYQLVYTIGNQQHIEGFPERWTMTQQILSLVKKHASIIQLLYPLGVEYERIPGSFPHFRILHSDAGKELVSRIMEDICNDRLPNLSYGNLRTDIKDAIKRFMSRKLVSRQDIDLIQQYFKESPACGSLLLLRGLLVAGILLFAFRERRWRVDYGLAPSRTMLAVPYRAKDVPAQRAEFGHPDIAILLTCLSYYYGGLTDEQLRTSFDILLQQDDPFADYDLWVQECSTVPESMRNLSGINIKSSEQWLHDLYPMFYRNKATIDFYLSRVVFPREAKEFPSKLSCSGWDLAEKRERLLTGFSGTNDGQYLLPLHIDQRDPDHQRSTNAKVLSYLLQSENRHYMCMTYENGERRSTEEFLQILASQKLEIRVLLDVGAQMLELQNDQLAKAWLDVKPDASAAIYFNEDDELTVLARDGHTELLLSSPFGQQLDRCVVYLDDAHTRGTDIKFPSGFRAAVTLGPKVTKDRLTQGCMRMRKLGHGHSVMFFAPLETDRKIRSLGDKDQADEIDTIDILHWAIRETCDDIQQRAPHWALQGTDHALRYSAWSEYCNDELTSAKLSEKWLQPEAKSLEKLYGPRNGSNLLSSLTPNIRQRCDELGILALRDASMDEEQEREVIHEAERERQVERPLKVSAATHSIHSDVTMFVKTGIIPPHSKTFRPAFETLEKTSAVTIEARVWGSSVLVTKDFEKTVQAMGHVDDYLRPVQWVVSGKRAQNDVLVILSPHEANHLIPHIRSRQNVRLHLYTPRIVKAMKPCDDLFLYSIPAAPVEWAAPAHLVDRLNVFAGQLYLKDYDAYIRLCRFLCVYARDLEGEDVEVGPNGFIEPMNRPEHLQSMNSFQNSPLLSVKKLMGIRRKGMSFPLTHMGKLLDGRVLSEDDFQDGEEDASTNYLTCDDGGEGNSEEVDG